jgi:hypothetical protein
MGVSPSYQVLYRKRIIIHLWYNVILGITVIQYLPICAVRHLHAHVMQLDQGPTPLLGVRFESIVHPEFTSNIYIYVFKLLNMDVSQWEQLCKQGETLVRCDIEMNIWDDEDIRTTGSPGTDLQ